MSTTAEAEVSETEIRRYEADGVICLRARFDREWVDRLRAATARSLEQGGFEMGREGEARFHSNMFMWRHDPDFRDFVFHSPAAAIARAVMQSRTARFYFDHLFVKEAGAQTRTPWHHDQPYWPVRGEQVASIWVTLDPVSVATSGLEYVRGSHRWGQRFDPAAFGEDRVGFAKTLHDDANLPIPDIDADRERYEILSWDMAPGDCLVHHSLAVHGAQGNASIARMRRALSTRWLGDDAIYWPLPNAPQQGGLNVEGLQPGEPLVADKFPLVSGGA